MKKSFLLFVVPVVACLAEPEENKSFAYLEFGGGDKAVWASVGMERYGSDYCSLYAGGFVAGVDDISDQASDGFTGLTLGARVCLPTRISPYVGAGVTGGWGRYYKRADTDGRDNDKDNLVDETGEEKKLYEMIASAFSEAGIHFWLNDKQRLTVNGRYHFTSEGDPYDYWTANIGWLLRY